MKIDRILFPIDFSDASLAMNSEVEWLASRFDARVILLHVFELPTGWYGTGEAPLMTAADLQAFAEAEKLRLKNYSIGVPENRVERAWAEGSAAGHIAQRAKEDDVDLIVMGTHGYGPFRRLLLGSVAMKVLHDVDCPIWTHPAPQNAKRAVGSGISTILCSLELTEEAIPLLRFTRDIADRFAAQVQLVHCVPEVGSRLTRYFDSELHRALKNLAYDEIATVQREAGTSFPVRITEHFIAQDIAELAAEQNAGLVIIGRGKLQGTFGSLRSHAYDIIRQTPCPVLSFSMAHGQGEREAEMKAHAVSDR